jgi:predicted metal-dependent enzyme (double-stranded beta helix superfamily)
MAEYSVPAFAKLIDDLRALWAKELPEAEHWESVRAISEVLCGDEAMREASTAWPAKRGVELQLHHDPDYAFFVGALIRQPHHRANVHDHGYTWTVYGVLDGEELTHVYKRLDDGSVPGKAELELIAATAAPAGHVVVVPPFMPHSEWGMGERSVAITVRSHRPGGHNQTRFNLETGDTNGAHRGLELIPTPV